MNIKVHFLHNHLERFPENLGDASDKQRRNIPPGYQINGEKVPRNMGDIKMMSDYCWNLKRDAPDPNIQENCEKKRFYHRFFFSLYIFGSPWIFIYYIYLFILYYIKKNNCRYF